MAAKKLALTFNQTIETLTAQGFTVSPVGGKAGGVLVAKYGAAAVLVPGEKGGSAIAEGPGILNGTEVAYLLDRGYQKFLKTAQFEVPATAGQLHSIHRFGEELKKLTGATDFFNQALGTTSDLYQYDRLRGRETAAAAPRRPWDPA